MKNRSFLLITAICAAFAVMTAGSCSKADFSDEQQAMSSIVGPPTTNTIIEVTPEPESPITCYSNGVKIEGTRLDTGTEYTFGLDVIYATHINGTVTPKVTMTVRNSAGTIVGNPEELEGDFTMMFTVPGNYTVEGCAEYNSDNIDYFSKNYTVTGNTFGPGIGRGDGTGIMNTPVLGQPFDLYLGKLSATTTTTLNVRETIFKKPYCTVVKKAENHYTITIKEPGAYIFWVKYTGDPTGLVIHGDYHVNLFYRPRLNCQSRRYGTNNYYENWAHLPGEIFNGEELIGAGFPHRLCFDYRQSNTFFSEEALPEGGTPVEKTFMAIYTNEPEDGYGFVRLDNTYVPMNKYIYLEEDTFKPNNRESDWVIQYPKDECYYLNMDISIATGSGEEVFAQ